MLLSLVYFVLRRLLHALFRQIAVTWNAKPVCWSSDLSSRSSREGVRRPGFRTRDRMVLAGEPDPAERPLEGVHRDPSTLLRWHRDLVRRKWRYRRRGPGRPPLDRDTAELIARMARENPRWGYLRIRGELMKLGIRVSATSIRTVLRREGLGPAPRRIGPSWSEFLRAQAHAIVAVDFFTVETAWLRTL